MKKTVSPFHTLQTVSQSFWNSSFNILETVYKSIFKDTSPSQKNLRTTSSASSAWHLFHNFPRSHWVLCRILGNLLGIARKIGLAGELNRKLDLNRRYGFEGRESIQKLPWSSRDGDFRLTPQETERWKLRYVYFFHRWWVSTWLQKLIHLIIIHHFFRKNGHFTLKWRHRKPEKPFFRPYFFGMFPYMGLKN